MHKGQVHLLYYSWIYKHLFLVLNAQTEIIKESFKIANI